MLHTKYDLVLHKKNMRSVEYMVELTVVASAEFNMGAGSVRFPGETFHVLPQRQHVAEVLSAVEPKIQRIRLKRLLVLGAIAACLKIF